MTSFGNSAAGPLAGLRVLEFESIGPGPHCAMLFSDLGADVVRIGREGGNGWPNPVVDRGRANVTIDIRTDDGRQFCLETIEKADVLIEGFRPGVMERLGLGPDVALQCNPRLIYGRMTGWGQDGPLARTAGHDINYIGVAGALAAIGKPGEPATPPLNLVGDFGGGSMYLAFGVMAALWERERSGKGQVIDAAIVDGVTSMMTMFSGLAPSGRISLDRSRNLLGGAAPFYRCYLCADGREAAIGALEPKFYADLVEKVGAPKSFISEQYNQSKWPRHIEVFEKIFKSRTSCEWTKILEGAECCFAPVLSIEEAQNHDHMRRRSAYVEHNNLRHAAPAPRFSRTPGQIQEDRNGLDVIASWPRANH